MNESPRKNIRPILAIALWLCGIAGYLLFVNRAYFWNTTGGVGGVDGAAASFAAEPYPLICFGFIWAALLLPVLFSLRSLRGLAVHISNFRRYFYLLSNLVRRDITTKYRRSVLGILWSVLNPLLMMAVMTVVFQQLFRIQIENFAMYYLSGALVFNFMSEATSGAMSSITGSGALIRKVYIPKYIFPMEKCLFALINALFSFIAVLIMLVIQKIPVTWSLLLFFIPILYCLVFCVGFGLALASLNVFFRDTGHLYSVWVTAWMYLTPIIYPIDILPPAVQTVVQFNPMFHYVEYFRQVVMYGTIPGLEANITCLIFSVFFLGAGLLAFKKNQDRFILFI
ncbi:MAG: ABC transporter permease [Clostridiales bacterium]|jgi:ABC-2 type transport system permease protein|nr:ABC transporter permease [Clostridiales bacterium]